MVECFLVQLIVIKRDATVQGLSGVEAGESMPLQARSAGQAQHAAQLANRKLPSMDEQCVTIQANLDTRIAAGYTHRLYNPGEAMYVIELHYPGDDDIPLIHDPYRRA